VAPPTEGESRKDAPMPHPIELLLEAIGEEALEPPWKNNVL
jgi:hypothetical protein